MKKKAIIITLLTLSISQFVNSQEFVKSSLKDIKAPSSEAYQSLTFNGTWCWFSDPRAVYYEGKHKRTYSGWVDNYGDIHVAYYDHDTKEIQSKVVYDKLEVDDHDNPSVLLDEQGRLLVFFTTHMIGTRPLYLVKSMEPESIDNWGEVKELYLNDQSLKDKYRINHNYTNPVKLSGEGGRIYLFWRGVDGKPCYSYSDDNGDAWSPGKVFFLPDPIYNFRRPYTKVYSNGVDKIHFAFTDGHPNHEHQNSIYYMYYKAGSFYKADGTKIREIGEAPILPTEIDKVHNAETGGGKAWTWDIAEDKKGNPIIAYTKFPEEHKHIYCYAIWDKNKWNNFDLINSGRWFPETVSDFLEPEPFYSGGIIIDHETPNSVYVSVNRRGVFEIEKWTTKNKGKSWEITKITDGSIKNNVRPFAVRGAKEGNPLQVLWMQNSKYKYFANASVLRAMGGTFKDRYHTAIKSNLLAPATSNSLNKNDILNMLRKTADWEIENPKFDLERTDWKYSVLYDGLRAFYELTAEERYKDELYNVGQNVNWQPVDSVVDDRSLIVMDNWAWLNSLKANPEIEKNILLSMDDFMSVVPTKSTKEDLLNKYDAAFLNSSLFAQMTKATGDQKYLNYMIDKWWKMSSVISNEESDLSFFWKDDPIIKNEIASRLIGNGWMLVGLTKVLSTLSDDCPNRGKFEQQFKELIKALLLAQGEDGLWKHDHSNHLLSPNEICFNAISTYAIAWGINNKLIDSKDQANIRTTWVKLSENITPYGRIIIPEFIVETHANMDERVWRIYTTGAYLLAGSEMYKLIQNANK